MSEAFSFVLPVRVEPDVRKPFRLVLVDANDEVIATFPDNRRRYKEAASFIVAKLNGTKHATPLSITSKETAAVP